MKTLFLCIFLLFAIQIAAQDDKVDAHTGATKKAKSSKYKESDFWKVIQGRRSVRKFKPDSVPDKDLVKMIDAARMAPTSGNQQPWKFLIVKDKNKIRAIKEACIAEALANYDNQKDHKDTREQYTEKVKKVFEDYCSAPVYIIVLTDNQSKYPDYNHWDGPLAAGYLMLAARSLGYGTVFITDAISEKVSKEILNIPDNYTRVCITPVGIPYEWPDTPSKKDLKDLIIREKF